MSQYTFRQYLSFRALIERLHEEDYRNYIQARLDAHPELHDKKQSWDKWKEEEVE